MRISFCRTCCRSQECALSQCVWLNKGNADTSQISWHGKRLFLPSLLNICLSPKPFSAACCIIGSNSPWQPNGCWFFFFFPDPAAQIRVASCRLTHRWRWSLSWTSAVTHQHKYTLFIRNKKKVIFIEAYWMRQKIWKTHKPSKNTHRNTCFESHVTCYMSHVESPELGHQSKPKCGEYFSMNYYSVTTITKNDTAQPWLHRSAHNPHRISPGHSEVRFFFFATCNLQLYKKQKWEFTPPWPQLSFKNGLIYVEI